MTPYLNRLCMKKKANKIEKILFPFSVLVSL